MEVSLNIGTIDRAFATNPATAAFILEYPDGSILYVCSGPVRREMRGRRGSSD
jgi:hypothetical protein